MPPSPVPCLSMRRYGADILGDLERLSLADPEVQALDLAREPDAACEPDLAAAPEVPFEEVAAKPHKWQARCTQLPLKAPGLLNLNFKIQIHSSWVSQDL